jgi:NAD(P)-dependent dehydrogenase (short-subunit alcohol dehydrogenase family)
VEALAEEYGAEGIRANAILPDTVDTEANRRAMPDADRSDWTSPEAIARLILDLTSPSSTAANGEAIPVYGRG